MWRCRSIPITLSNRCLKLSIGAYCLNQYLCEIVDRYLLFWQIGMWNYRSIPIALTNRYNTLDNSLLNMPICMWIGWGIACRYLLSRAIGWWNCRPVPNYVPNRSREFGMIDTLETITLVVVFCCPKQQVSIDILINLPGIIIANLMF